VRSFTRTRRIKATRKVHACIYCNTLIPVGSPALYVAGLNDGTDYRFMAVYICARDGHCAYEPETNHQDVPQTDIYPF
jgi:hypothetical protein